MLARRKPKRTRLSVEDRRSQLLALGLEAFTKQSYETVSVDAIAAKAGVSRGLLFHYFPTKHDFYVAVLRVASDEMVQGALARNEGTPAERLVGGLTNYFRFVGDHDKSYAMLLRAAVGSDRTVMEVVEATRDRIAERIRAEVLPVLASDDERRLARAALRGWIGYVEFLALDWIDARGNAKRDRRIDSRALSIDELVQLCIRAILSVPGADKLLSGARA